MSILKNTLDKNFAELTQVWNKLVAEKFLKRVEEKKKEIIAKINSRES